MIKSKKDPSNIHLYSLHSTKGGVGKTSLAVAIACKESIASGKKVLIIDGDLTGTSMHDIFIKAKPPEKWFNHMLLDAPSEHLKRITVQEKQLHDIDIPEYSVTGNDSLFSYLPSSAMYKDVREIVPLVMQEDCLGFFSSRIEELLCRLIRREQFNSIIIDTHPGFYGLSKAIFSLLLNIVIWQKDSDEVKPHLIERLSGYSNSDKTDISVKPVFVLTTDSADYLSSVPTISDMIFDCVKENDKRYEKLISSQEYPFVPIINKAESAPGEKMNSPFILQKMFERLEMKEKNDGYYNKRNDRIQFVLEFMKSFFEEEGSHMLPWVNGFSIEDLPIVAHSVESGTYIEAKSTMRKWYKSIKEAVAI